MQSSILQNPPYCNTGVQYTISPHLDKSYSIDWLRFTTGKIKYGTDGEPTNTSIPLINKLLTLLKSYYNYFDLELVPGGLYGYRFRMYVSEGLTIYFNGPLNKKGEITTMVEITGTGCDKLSTIEDWFELMSYILSDEIDANITRIDLAIDDFYGKEIASNYFFDVIKKGFYKRSGSPRSKIEWIINDWKNYDEGCTVNFYAKTSDLQLCVYNKKAEVKAKKDKDTDTPQWMRYEMRFFDTQAQAQIRSFYNCLLKEKFNLSSCSSIASFLSSALYDLLKLYIPSNDKHKDRWEENPSWLKFIGDLTHIQFDRNKSKKNSILKTKEYFENNYAKFLLKMYLVFGKKFLMLWLLDFMFVKRDSLEAKDFISINDLRHDLNLKLLTSDDIFLEISRLEVINSEDIKELKKYNLNCIGNFDATDSITKALAKYEEEYGEINKWNSN